VLKKQGAFYSYGELRLGQGRENSRNYLLDNPDLATKIEDEIRAVAAAGAASAAAGHTNGAKPLATDDEDEEPEDEG
jgi:recombination protein RecA